VRKHLQRFLNSLQSLHMKYSYGEGEDTLNIDATDSGFPNHYELSKLEVDQIQAKQFVVDKLPVSVMKRKMVDYMFKKQKDPVHLLSNLAERVYYDSLLSHEQFNLFSTGNLIDLGNGGYVYDWAAFDSSTNMPYIYTMTFETSFEKSFHTSPDEVMQFLKVVKSWGNRAPKLNLVAAGIDSDLSHIHPKVLKRVRIGPFFAADFAQHSDDKVNSLLALADPGRRFILEMREDHVFSEKQVQPKKLFAKGQKREIFHVPKQDMDLYERGISGGESMVILPYELHQNMGRLFEKSRVFSFDKQGHINHG